MDIYSMVSRAHMERCGITQRQLSVIAAKNYIMELGQVTLTYSRAPFIILPSH